MLPEGEGGIDADWQGVEARLERLGIATETAIHEIHVAR